MNHAVPLAEFQRVQMLVGAGRAVEAVKLADELIAKWPGDSRLWRARGEAQAQSGQLQEATESILRAVSCAPADPGFYVRCGQFLASIGQRREALEVGNVAASFEITRADVNDALGTLFSFCDEPIKAQPYFEAAVRLAPDNGQYLLNLATAQRMAGGHRAAEASLTSVLARDPSNASAYYIRSDLRTQTRDENHVDEMISALATKVTRVNDKVQLGFAIAKELDDIGDFDRSFQHLKAASELQRRTFSYDVGDDIATIDQIIRGHRRGAFRSPVGIESEEAIFVLGLPRSGTTLVEQILASHRSVYGAGELQAFPSVAIRAVQQIAGRHVSKREFVDFALQVGGRELALAYLAATRPQTGAMPRFTDKQPMNYLYAGMIGHALPNSRVVAVMREPVDSCFALYRTLFVGAYPFSYDLTELAHYYCAWRRLMTHWQEELGDRLLVVRYEDLVLDLEATIVRILSHCGLEWDAACLAFHEQPRVVATASAVQVRRPIYASSIGKWRNYERHLQPLVSALRVS